MVGRGGKAPHPFVFWVPGYKRDLDVGDELYVEMTLVGSAIRHLPYLVLAFRSMGDRRTNGRKAVHWPFDLQSVDQIDVHENASPVFNGKDDKLKGWRRPVARQFQKPSSPVTAKIEFVTPTSLKTSGRVLERAPGMSVLVSAVVRRIAGLCAAHTDLPLLENWEALEELSRGVALTGSDVRLLRWTWASRRQGGRMPMMGLAGRVEYEAIPGGLVPWLRLGSLLQIGKGTAFGLGKYMIKVKRKLEAS